MLLIPATVVATAAGAAVGGVTATNPAAVAPVRSGVQLICPAGVDPAAQVHPSE
ncbi:hypothetical protein [Amycolatopsis plumensis]|uniref:hypothetical protein n=1 Tax=Amycolatopsis plumensis TaxID=236508 RepID=UPI00361BC31A